MNDSGLHILNCNEGDIRISFDKGDPADVEKAKGAIEDMLKRGYFLFVEDAKGNCHKVAGFDPDAEEYILASKKPKDKKTRTKAKRVKMREARATGMAPTSGG